MSAVIKTVDSIKDYESKGYNILLPSQSLQRISEFHDVSWEVVKLSVDDDAYPQDNYDRSKAKEFSLNKVGLMKLSHGAGIAFDPAGTRRIDPMNNRDYVAFQALGRMQKSDGQWIYFTSSADMDMEVEEADLRALYEKKARRLTKGFGANQRDATDEEKLNYIEQMVRQELLRKRKFKVPLTETKAVLRVIRGLLAIKSVYKKEELQKPFVVPRIVFSPDLSDPEIRRVMLMTGIKAIEQTYGGASVPAYDPKIHSVIEIPHTDHGTNGDVGEDTEPETGQVEEEHKPEESAPKASVLPFQIPPEYSSIPGTSVKSVDEFRKLKSEQREPSLRLLMLHKHYPEAALRDPKIDQWPAEQQDQFCAVLLSLRDK